MKNIIAVQLFGFFFAFCFVNLSAQNIKTELLFETGKVFDRPESAVYRNGFIYVSNVGGNPSEKDGTGWITKLDLKGNIVSDKWVSGLDAPKGMAVKDNRLYVTDIDRVLVIDIAKAKIIREIRFDKVKPAPEFLNDITIAPFGCIFISDSSNGVVYKTNPRNFTAMVYLKNPPQYPNGLYATNSRFYVAGQRSKFKQDKGGLFYIKFGDKKRVIHNVSKPLGALDGLAWFAKYKWLVSDHSAGKIYLIDSRNGQTQILIENLKTPADINFVPQKSMMLVPLMQENKLKVYELKILKSE